MNREEHIILLQRLLIFCGFTLIGCIVFKLFGTEVFDLKVTNERLLFIDNFVDSNFFLYHLVRLVSYSFNVLLASLLITRSTVKDLCKSLRMVCFILFAGYIIRLMLPYNISLFLFDFLFILFINYSLVGHVLFKYSFYIGVLIITYQILSLFLRNFSISVVESGLAVNCIFMLDYYILMIATYAYAILNKQKGDV